MMSLKRNFENPLVSVLLPTRGRPGMLSRAVDSLYSLSANRVLIEYLFAVDDDDHDTIDCCTRILTQLTFDQPDLSRIVIAPRGRGYMDTHTRYNAMAKRAKGDWLFLFNDDAVVATEGWDHILLNMPFVSTRPHNEILMLTTNINGTQAPQFPIIRRKVFEILGHISVCPQCDLYLDSLFSLIQSKFATEIEIHHEVTIDQTSKDAKEYYHTSIEMSQSSEIIRAVIGNALKLLDYKDFGFNSHAGI